MIQETLNKLGLNEKEISVYLTILEHGKLSPARIAKITHINRATIYSTAKELVKKSLINEDLGGKQRSFVALPPEQLTQLIERKERELKQTQLNVEKALIELADLPKFQNYSIPKIQYIEERNIADFLKKQTPIWNKNLLETKRTTWNGFQDHSFVEVPIYKKWIEWYWHHPPKNITLELITNNSKAEEQIKQKGFTNRSTKFWKDDFRFSATQWVIGDYVVMIVTNQKPHYLVQIHDSVYAQNMYKLFKSLWGEI